MTTSRSIILGTILGGAVGDAMGAPFEGLWSDSIPDSESLLSNYHEYHGYPSGQYTDDTQLTLATIKSIVRNSGIELDDIARTISELWRHHAVIGPGGACTQAAERYLATRDYRTMGAPIGQAGNGTAMRTAAIGLWFGHEHSSLITTVADISRLTHTDERSVAGGVAIALAANLLANDNQITTTELCHAIAASIESVNSELSSLVRVLPEKMRDSDCLRFIASAGQTSAEFAAPIISPFVIPTVLASLYCINKHRGSWADAVTCAVGLGGDVDTLGAIVGALAGACHGVEAIPLHLLSELQDSESIQTLATRYHSLIADFR